MPLTISEIGIVPSVERFVSTNYLLRHIRVLGLLMVLTLFVSISAYILALHYGHPTQFFSSEPRVGFQADSGGRDSMDVISACASTLITCVYSSVHFDVPRSYAHRLSLRQKLVARDYWLELWVKVTFWLLGIFSPEMLVLHAFFEYMIARRDVAWMREHGHPDWTVALAFAADMGALIPEGAREGERPPHSGFALHEALLRHHEPGALDCRALEHELADHTKADVLFKLLTTLQIARFFAGTVARWAVRLPIAPLETITCAYVACTLVYYGFWLQKPYNVNERIIVRLRPTLPRARRIAPDSVLAVQDPQPAAVAAGEGSKWVGPLRAFSSKFCATFWEPPMSETDRLHGSERMWQSSPCKDPFIVLLWRHAPTYYASAVQI